MDVKKLQDQRLNLWENMKATLDGAESEGRGLTVEEQTSWDERNADLDRLDQRIKNILDAQKRDRENAEALEALGGKPQHAQVRGGYDSTAAEIRSFLKGEGGKALDFRPSSDSEFRDLTKGTATAGGNTVPTSFYGQLMEHMIEVSGLLQGGPTFIRTDGGENFEVPVTTAHSSAALIAEAGTLTESDPAFAKRTLGAYKYGMSMQVSSELLADSGVDLTGYLARQAGRAVGNALGTDLAVGNASSKPSGVAQTSTLGVTGSASVAGAFTADNLIDLYYSVISPYRNSASCNWLMRDATLAAVRKLKDSQNQYLWQPSLIVGAPETILGKPVRTDPNFAAVALSAKSVLFGDLSAYIVRLAGGVRFERSDDFAFQNDLVTFRCIIRGDGILADQTGAVKHFIGNAA